MAHRQQYTTLFYSYYLAKNLSGNYFKIDANNNGEIEVSEALQVSYLELSNSSITSIIGILNFNNLQYLICGNNQLSTLDIISLTNLKELHCRNNLLSSLNVTTLTNLQQLDFYNNQLTSLDMSGLSNLQLLDCTYNQFPSLDVSSLVNLETLVCGSSTQLTSLNVSGLTKLTFIDCSADQLSSLDVSSLTNLTTLDCTWNQLTLLDVGALTNLTFLYCTGNQLTSLFIKNNSYETTLNFDYNPNLQYVCVDNDQLNDVQTMANSYGYTSCVVDSLCPSLKAMNFEYSNNINVFPNPVKDILTIDIKEDIIITSINIYNTLGQLVIAIPNAQSVSNIDVCCLTTGNYFIKMITDKGTSNTKFIKN